MPTITRIEEAIRLLQIASKSDVKGQEYYKKSHRHAVAKAIRHLIAYLSGKPLTTPSSSCRIVGVTHDSDRNVCKKCGVKRDNGTDCPGCRKKESKNKNDAMKEMLEENIIKHQCRVQKDLKELREESVGSKYVKPYKHIKKRQGRSWV